MSEHPPWQVPEHKKKSHGPSKAWQKAVDNPPPVKPMVHSRLLRLVIFLIGMALLLLGLSIAIPLAGGVDPYLVRSILIAVIFGGAAAYWSRSSLFKIAKVAGLWFILIAGVSIFYLYQSDFSDRFMSSLDPSGVTVNDEGMIVHRAQDGHFWLRVAINRSTILMMVDTGASNVVLSPKDAQRVGFNNNNLVFDRQARTANGNVSFARVNAEVFSIGDAIFYDVPVTVNGAEMNGSLLGMSALDLFGSVEFRGDELILRR